MAETKSYLKNATALRGIAALLVVVFHSNETSAAFISTDTTFWFRKLYLMVDLFFVLSGFIMCYVYEDYFNNPLNSRKTVGFLKARFARIYPLHFVTLAFCVSMTLITIAIGKYGYNSDVVKAIEDFRIIPGQLLLLHSANIANIFTWNVPSWSISAEWFAYMLFPFLVVPFSKFNLKQLSLAIVIIILLYAGFVFYIVPNRNVIYPFLKPAANLDATWDWGFARGILGFTLGMCVYRLYIKNVFKNVIGNGWFLLGTVILYSLYMHFNLSDFGAPIFYAIIVLSAVYGSPSINRFFGITIFQKLGDWSFSIYMWHMVFLILIWNIQTWMLTAPPSNNPGPTNYFGLTNPLIILLVFTIIVIIIGRFSFIYLEKPTRTWINGWGKKKRKDNNS